MKRVFRLIALSLMFVLLLAMTAQADLIVEPQDPFYQAHRRDCERYHRDHYINASNGALAIYSEPYGTKKLGTLQNGAVVVINYTYENGSWGFGLYLDSDSGKYIQGWIDMKQTVLKYDWQCFVEEHSDQFYEDTDYISRTMLKDFERKDLFYIYPYPGVKLLESRTLLASYVVGYHYKFQCLFEDINGRIWGCLDQPEHGGSWLCLSDPTNPDLPVIEYQTLDTHSTSEIAPLADSIPAWVLPTCLVAGVAVLSFVLILVLKRKKGTQSWNNAQPGVTKPKTMKGRMKSLQCTGWRGDDRDFEA